VATVAKNHRSGPTARGSGTLDFQPKDEGPERPDLAPFSLPIGPSVARHHQHGGGQIGQEVVGVGAANMEAGLQFRRSGYVDEPIARLRTGSLPHQF
jgi:hypothetical protein